MSTLAMSAPQGGAHRAGFLTLALGSIGVVYGDIGTSPLYALKESLRAASAGTTLAPEATVGVVSLILWTLFVIVTLKYVLLVMSADNAGEGGTLALMALAQRAMGNLPVITLLGMFGAALFYGDAVLTPAVSVLSAVEGLKLVSPHFDHWVIPLAIVVLVALFAVQSRGTARVAAFFGPVMAGWFLVIALAGLPHIAVHPEILAALNPLAGLSFLAHHGVAALFALGAVFLAVTGAEALYADMGHFGSRPIRLAWLVFVGPALALNYLGQGALLLADPGKLENPFFLLFPEWALIPMVLFATVATVIASQAVITGAYSLTQQAIQLKILPRMVIRRTSETERGQIYIGRINAMLLAAVILLVLNFRSSDALAAAYGIAVTGTMVITVILAFFVIWKVWGRNPWMAAALLVPFAAIDLAFLAANSLKVADGGWLPLLFGCALMAVMVTWRRGSDLLAAKQAREAIALAGFLPSLTSERLARVEGTGVFLTPHADEVPPALLHNLKHNRVVHETTVVLVIAISDAPRVAESARAQIETLARGVLRVSLAFGFMEVPNIPAALKVCRKMGWRFETMKTSFFLSKRTLKCSARTKMPWWQDHLFVALADTQSDASDHFHIPTERAVELGRQVSI